MLQSVSEIAGYTIRAADGVVGDVYDLRFRDSSWAIRYLVVATGGWLRGRKVLVPTEFACSPDIVEQELAVGLSRAQVNAVLTDEAEAQSLRSVRELIGVPALACDEQSGRVDDLLFDDASWLIRYLVIDTRHWLAGRKVLVSAAWAQAVDCRCRELRLSLDRQAVRFSPTYDPARPIDRDYDARLDRLTSCRHR